MKLLLISCLLLASALAQTVTKTFEQIPDSSISWQTLDSGLLEITLDMGVPGNDKWFAFGLTSSGNMANGDAFVAYTDTETLVRVRLEQQGLKPLPVDEQSQHTLVSFSVGDERTIVTWTMSKQHYCDPMLDILDLNQWFAYAYGTMPFTYHTSRGAMLANMGSTTATVVPDLSQDATLGKINMVMPTLEVEVASNSYYCVAKEVPGTENYRAGQSAEDAYPDKKFIIGHKPIITSEMVHHMVLFHCDPSVSYYWDLDDTRQTDTVFECENMPSGCEMVAGAHSWAPGDENYWMYNDFQGKQVGLEVGGDQAMHLVLQMHYNNPMGKPGVMDSSGFDLYYTEEELEYAVSMDFYGPSLDKLQIPPCQDWFSLQTFFPPPCQAYFTTPKYILGVFPHMHLLGASASATLIKESGETIKLVNKTYHFDFQTVYTFGEAVTFESTDAISMDCVFDTSTYEKYTYGGDYSEEEMCFFGMLFIRDAEIEEYGCEQMTHFSFVKDGGMAPDMEQVFAENGVDVYNTWSDEDPFFAMVPDTLEDTSFIPPGITQYVSNMNYKNFQVDNRNSNQCPWAKDYDLELVGDPITWPEAECATDDDAGFRQYYESDILNSNSMIDVNYYNNFVFLAGCGILGMRFSEDENEVEGWHYCNTHYPRTAELCPCACSMFASPCENQDEEIIEAAAGIGLTVTGCDDPQVLNFCKDATYGADVTRMCPSQCKAATCVGCTTMCQAKDATVLWPECTGLEEGQDANDDQTTCESLGGTWELRTCGYYRWLEGAGYLECSEWVEQYIHQPCSCDDGSTEGRRVLHATNLLDVDIEKVFQRRILSDHNEEEMECSVRTTASPQDPTDSEEDQAIQDSSMSLAICAAALIALLSF